MNQEKPKTLPELKEAITLMWKTHECKINTKNDNIYRFENEEDAIVVFFHESNLVFQYNSKDPMESFELSAIKRIARTWISPCQFKRYGLSILVGEADWYFDTKVKNITAFINGMINSR